MQYEYYYQGLSMDERRIYRVLSDGIKEVSPYVKIVRLKAVNIKRIFRAIEYDHPELYYWNSHLVKSQTRDIETILKLDYFWSIEEIKSNAPKIEKGVKEILAKCKNQHGSEYDRFKSIYDCMARNISYDFQGLHSNNEREMAYIHTILGVFARKKAVCDGIAKAFKYVLERSGIDCIVVCGKKRGEVSNNTLHAWNIVYIDNKPCHVDLTWAVENSSKKVINHDYVGLTDKQIGKDHQIDDILKTPKCHNQELDYYVRNKAVLKSEKELRDYLQLHTENKPFEINVRLDFSCDILEIAKKATDYIIEHYVLTGRFVKVQSQCRENQNILILIGT